MFKHTVDYYNGIYAPYGYDKWITEHRKDTEFFAEFEDVFSYELKELFLSYGIEFSNTDRSMMEAESDIPFIWERYGAKLFQNKERKELKKFTRSKVSQERMKILISLVKDESCAILNQDGSFATSEYLRRLLNMSREKFNNFIKDMCDRNLIKTLYFGYAESQDNIFYIINPMVLDFVEVIPVSVYFSFVDTLIDLTDKVTRDKYKKLYPMYLVYVDIEQVDLSYEPDLVYSLI